MNSRSLDMRPMRFNSYSAHKAFAKRCPHDHTINIDVMQQSRERQKPYGSAQGSAAPLPHNILNEVFKFYFCCIQSLSEAGCALLDGP